MARGQDLDLTAVALEAIERNPVVEHKRVGGWRKMLDAKPPDEPPGAPLDKVDAAAIRRKHGRKIAFVGMDKKLPAGKCGGSDQRGGNASGGNQYSSAF